MGDFDVNPGEELGLAVKGNLGTPFEAKLVMQPDLTLGQLKISLDGQAIAFAQMKGQASAGESGLAVSYVVKYHVGSQAGKAKIDLTGRLPYCSLSINLVPTVDRAIEHHFKMGFELSKAEGRWVKDVKDNLHYNLTTEDRVEQTKENPFFEIVNSFYGTELTSSKKTQRIFISQTEMDEILNNQIVQLRVNKVLLEEEYTVNGQTRYHFKYDNRAPRAEYFLRYAPQDHPETEWWFAGSREVGDNSVELNHKITHGTSVVQKGMIKFDSESTLQGKYWKEAKRTMQLRVEPNHFTLSELFLQDETVLDGELYRLVKIAWRNHDNEELDLTWEQPGSGGLLPTTRDVFNQDKVNFAAKTEHRKPAEGDFYTAIVLTSNLPTRQNLTASYEIIPSGDIIDLIAKLVLNDRDLVTFRTDHTDNSAKLIVSPPGGEETVVSIAIPGLQYPAFPETFFDPFPSSEPTPLDVRASINRAGCEWTSSHSGHI